MKLIWLILFLPVVLTAQTNQKSKVNESAEVQPQTYIFHFLTMDDFLTTSAEKGGTVIYKYDTTGLKIEGEIEVNPAKKFIEIIYSADKKHPMRAMLDGKPKIDQFDASCTYKAHWLDTDEKTEITIGANDTSQVIKVLFGPHKGDYASYWDRIYKYTVIKKG